jgi:hypothetical protein
MADYHLEWNGSGAIEHVRGKAMGFIRRACIEVKRRAKQLLAVAGSGRVKGRKSGPIVRSLPGEPPRKQTGRLWASVDYEVDEADMSGRVGTNVEYGRALELGKKRGLKPRPWLRRALAEMTARVNELLAAAGPEQ